MTRNVAILVLDSVRKDVFDSRAERIRAKAGVSIDQARAPSSWSTPSHASVFTGQLPSEHGVHTYHRSFDDTRPESIFRTRLPHRTVGVSANAIAGSEYGFGDFFDSFVDVTPSNRRPDGLDPAEFTSDTGRLLDQYVRFGLAALREPNTVASLHNGVAGLLHSEWKRIPGPKLVDDTGNAVRRTATEALDRTAEPWLLFANFMDAHVPLQHFRGLDASIHEADASWSSDEYTVWELIEDEHPDYWETRESVYAAYVEYLDRLVNRFVEDVERATASPTTVIVTADHGENHGEESADGMANHKSSMSEQLLHVPLEIINPPEHASSVDGTCTLLDLPELVTAIARDEWYDVERDVVPAEVLGMSAGPEPPDDFDRDYYDRAIRVAYDGETKIVWDSLGSSREYRLDESTPSDQTLVAEGVPVPEWAMEPFSTGIDEAVAEARSRTTDDVASKALEARLKELGYR